MTPVNPLTPDAPDAWTGDRHSPLKRLARKPLYAVTSALIGRWPSAGIRAAGTAGALLHRLALQAPSAADLSQLLPARLASAQTARASASLRFKNHAAIAVVQRNGITGLVPLLDERAADPPRVLVHRPGGMLITAFHLGAHFGLGAALAAWRIPVLSLREVDLGEGDARARGLRAAIDTVRSGGIALSVVDGPGGASSEPVPCLGRQVVFRRGPLVVARLTGAPIVPMVARWASGGRITLVVGSPLEVSVPVNSGADFERATAVALARWLEAHVLAHADDLWPYTIRNLMRAPRLYGDVHSA